MERIRRQLESVRRRMGLSAMGYLAFAGLAIGLSSRGLLMRDPWMLGWMGPLVVSFLLLPSQAMPLGWPQAEDPAEQDEIDLYRAQARVLEGQLTMIRVAYVVLALVLVLLIPRLLAG
jgi:hypothetical protein